MRPLGVVRMANIEGLVREYERTVSRPWEERLAGPQKVWFALYAPGDERRLRARLGAFEVATAKAGHGWKSYDLTDDFARWMTEHQYRERFFRSPAFLTNDALKGFDAYVTERLKATLSDEDVDERTVVAVWGVASLFGLTRVSRLMEPVTDEVKGRLLVFFPGERDGSNYRLLDARDGWNYLATPIVAQEGSAV